MIYESNMEQIIFEIQAKTISYDTPKMHFYIQTIEFQLLMNNIMIIENKVKL